MKYDVMIIGGGPGGLSAGLWCDDLGLEAILLESGSELGGQLLWTHNAIENHLATRAENGRHLRDLMVGQIRNRRFERRFEAEVTEVRVDERSVRLKNGEILSAGTLIIATGVRRRKLGIAGESEFQGRGILSSGSLERSSVTGQTVVIVGGGDAALENALILSGTADRVLVAHRRKELRAREEFVKKAIELRNVRFLPETVLTEIVGSDRVTSVMVRRGTGDEPMKLAAEAVLIRIGVEPNTDFLRGQVELDKEGYIKVDSSCETSINGVFAAGDAANPHAPTISAAVGMGAVSVKSAYAWLNR